MFWKVEGATSSHGIPRWVNYYCSDRCMGKDGFERGDAAFVAKDEVTPKMLCWHCGCSLASLLEAFYQSYPMERVRA